jgi:hypothetical protein
VRRYNATAHLFDNSPPEIQEKNSSMLIGLIGPGYAGRKSIVRFLTDNFGFKALLACNYTTIDELVDYSTNNWMVNMVVVLDKYPNIDLLLKRPFFLLVAVLLISNLIIRLMRR